MKFTMIIRRAIYLSPFGTLIPFYFTHAWPQKKYISCTIYDALLLNVLKKTTLSIRIANDYSDEKLLYGAICLLYNAP